jgi:hypothetical protein
MKTENKYYRSEESNYSAPTVKTLDIKLSVSDRDLGAEVKQAFNLAKSSGRELTLYFSSAKSLPQGVC